MKPRCDKSRRRAGPAFTLVEVLVAITVFAIIISAISGVFYAGLQLRNRTMDNLEKTMPLEFAFDSMHHDIANLVAPRNGVGGTFFGPLMTDSPSNSLPNQVGPDFYTSAGELDGIAPWGNVEKVDYVLATPTNNLPAVGKDLWRAVTHNLLPINPPAQPDEEQLILRGVQTLTFLYYDGTQWEAIWDTTTQTNLPLAIKVQIQLTGANSLAVNAAHEDIVPIDLMVTTNQTSAMP